MGHLEKTQVYLLDFASQNRKPAGAKFSCTCATKKNLKTGKHQETCHSKARKLHRMDLSFTS